jgi:hypothetical protein
VIGEQRAGVGDRPGVALGGERSHPGETTDRPVGGARAGGGDLIVEGVVRMHRDPPRSAAVVAVVSNSAVAPSGNAKL